MTGDGRNVQTLEREVFKPLGEKASGAYRIVCISLGIVFLWALVAWGWQIQHGLEVTGLNLPVFWGFYIINFVFFIGISHAGTLISAILRIINAGWRCPLTRIAELITVTSLPFAASCVIIDLGRPDRFMNVLLYPHLTSPILWDVLCITTYLVMSCAYFYIALIPDLAACRDRLTGISRWRSGFYRTLSLGWTGTEQQVRLHDRFMTGLSIFLLAIVVSVHTNVGFIFGMTVRTGWHSAIIGPYFVVGAAFQGLGALAFFACIFRRIFRLERWITEHHFRNLGGFLLAMACFWVYMTFAEHLTAFYGGEESHMVLWERLFAGLYAREFWLMVVCCFIIPFPILVVPKWRTPINMCIVGLSVNIGMWLERFCVVVPPASTTFLPMQVAKYSPSWVEWSITAGWVAGFTLLLLLFVRIFPSITMWEVKEELHKESEPRNEAATVGEERAQ